MLAGDPVALATVPASGIVSAIAMPPRSRPHRGARRARAALLLPLPLLLLAAPGCGPREASPPRGGDAAGGGAQAGAADAAGEFDRGVVEVTDGVHVAVGYGLGNSVMIVGDGGVVLVDTLESAEAAGPVREAFGRVSGAPVAAIVYTHNHADHIFGGGVLAGGGSPEVFAHATFQAELDRLVARTRPVAFRRAMRQFGTLLPDDERGDCGIGPRLATDATTTASYLPPTRTFDGDRLDVTIAGIRLVLLHLPGETPDHVAVWLPDRGVLVSGDNYYHSFPNLYAIRGTAPRDVGDWVASLDAMRALRPSFLVPGHTMPVRGEDEIQRRLTDYRDAIQYVHDQTVRRMNEGQGPDEIAATLRLPELLASRPYLAERYGRVDWSARGVFDAYLGWFGGDAAELSPLTKKERALRVAALAGGSERLRDRAKDALARDDARWALELADHLLALDELTGDARSIRAAALRALAAAESSANGRNWYLTQALEAEGRVTVEAPDPSRTPDELLERIPVGSFLRAMTVRLDPSKAGDKRLVVALRFTDTGEQWGMKLRNGVVELAPSLPDGADMTVTTDTRTWKRILTGKRNATLAFADGSVAVDRNRLELVRFLFLFR